MILQDKYAIDETENIWIAKRLLVDSVSVSYTHLTLPTNSRV